ncbi:MAG: ECF transporter S component [Bacillota bacterium]|nr:ECF transporter S component [Bacillota bacterium]
MLKKFTMFDLMVITMMAVLGIAVKPVIVPLAQIITGPLYIPGGVLAGGFYMLFIVLGRGLVDKPGAATLIGLVQAILMIALGMFGTHGAASLVTYVAPGVAVDLLYLLVRSGVNTPIGAFLGGAAANITGTYLVNLAFFRLPWLPLTLGLAVAALSGGLGGLIACSITRQLKKFNLQSS